VTLDEFKTDPAFAGWDLLRIGRLSVVPVPQKMWGRIEQLARQGDGDAAPRAGKAPPKRATAKAGGKR
jgi:hypothetical protein